MLATARRRVVTRPLFALLTALLTALPATMLTGCGNDATTRGASVRRADLGDGTNADRTGTLDRKENTAEMTDRTATADRPALDARAPEVIRTATFALG